MRAVWFDTSAFLALWLHFDALNAAAGRAWETHAEAVKPWSWLHRIEVFQTLRNLPQRKPAPLKPAEAEAVIRAIQADVYGGVLQAVEPDLAALLREAEGWSAAHGAKCQAAAFDLLHVAGALVTGAAFVTGDKRQAAAARRAGLKVELIA